MRYLLQFTFIHTHCTYSHSKGQGGTMQNKCWNCEHFNLYYFEKLLFLFIVRKTIAIRVLAKHRKNNFFLQSLWSMLLKRFREHTEKCKQPKKEKLLHF